MAAPDGFTARTIGFVFGLERHEIENLHRAELIDAPEVKAGATRLYTRGDALRIGVYATLKRCGLSRRNAAWIAARVRRCEPLTDEDREVLGLSPEPERHDWLIAAPPLVRWPENDLRFIINFVSLPPGEAPPQVQPVREGEERPCREVFYTDAAVIVNLTGLERQLDAAPDFTD